MPNHVHGIVILPVETLHCNVSTTREQNNDKNEFMSGISPKSGSIATVIRSYKSACTKHINIQFPDVEFGWQSRFHDHIIRNQEEFERIENYINNNPVNWANDVANAPL